MAKVVKYLSFILLVSSLGLLVFTKISPPKVEKIVTTVSAPIIDKSITLALAGDIMLDRGVKKSVYKNFSGDYEQLFNKIKDKLIAYDFLFANLEGPISDKGRDTGSLYSFRFEPKVAPVLKNVGFDALSVANNHIFNWGQAAFTDTLEYLTTSGVKYVGGGFDGSEAYGGAIFNIDGVRITMLGFSEFTVGGVSSTSTSSGIAVISEENIRNSVSLAKIKSDLVIVSFHFGEEYQKMPNDYQKKYAQLAIDSGADLVVGHHPHVVESLEQYKNSYIIYSLGNLIFDQYFSEETMSGGLLEVRVDTVSKKIESVALKKVTLNRFYQIESLE